MIIKQSVKLLFRWLMVVESELISTIFRHVIYSGCKMVKQFEVAYISTNIQRVS